MKVVRKPDYGNWAWKFVCWECTAELEACATDVKAKFHEAIYSPKPGDGAEAHWTFHVTCPICTTERQVLLSDVPKGLQFELKDRYTKSQSQPVKTYTGDR